MTQTIKKSTTRKRNRRLHRLLNEENEHQVPLRAHGFGSTTLADALVLPLFTDNGSALLGLWSRLGENFLDLWEAGPQDAKVVQAQDPRGRWVLARAMDAHLFKAVMAPNFKKILQKSKVDLDNAFAMTGAMEALLKEGPQDGQALRNVAALYDMDAMDPLVARRGKDQVFDAVLAALFASHRIIKVPPKNRWHFHEWDIKWVEDGVSEKEALDILSQRYCAAYPFAQMEDFAWWMKMPPGKVKQAFIEAKTQWRNQNEPQEEELGLVLLPYRDMVAEGTRFYEKAWGLKIDPHPRAPGALPLVIMDGRVIGFWRTDTGALQLDEEVEAACEEEAGTLLRLKNELAEMFQLRLTELIPLYDVYR